MTASPDNSRIRQPEPRGAQSQRIASALVMHFIFSTGTAGLQRTDDVLRRSGRYPTQQPRGMPSSVTGRETE